MQEILSIQTPVVFDESVAHYELHAHQPYTPTGYNNSDEIRIAIQHQDLYVLPSRSSLHIHGRLTKADATNSALARTQLVNNAICHMFEEIRYEMNAVEIDRSKNVGLSSLMKGWLSFTPSQSSMLENAGWLDVGETSAVTNDAGYFDINIPLSMILGFAEDYRKIVVNVKHELILTRSRSDLNAVTQTSAQNTAGAVVFEDFRIGLLRIEWIMPYVVASNVYKIRLLSAVEKNKPISMSFRSWELYEYPVLPTATKHVWTVKTSNQLEKPRFVILALQTNRKNQRTVNASRFDHCNLSNVKLFLNSQYYPYGNLNLDINRNQYSILYDMYTHFQNAYYGVEKPKPMLSKTDFITHIPLFVIDCSKQSETLKMAPVDVRLEFESRDNFPTNTSAYCLILHDRIVQYSPVSGDVKKLV